YNFQLHGNADQRLRQRIVDLARDSAALLQNGFEARFHFLKPPPISQTRQKPESRNQQEPEPKLLVHMRLHVEYQGSIRTPRSSGVTSGYAERVGARGEVRVVGNGTSSRIDPVFIEALQFVLVAQFVRSGKTEPGVFER